MCERIKNIYPLVNDTAVCQFFRIQKSERSSTYAEASGLTLGQMFVYYKEELFLYGGKCTYLDLNYMVFVPIALGLIYSMIKDTKRLISASKYTDAAHQKTCASYILPLGMDIINLLLILLVLVGSDAVLPGAIGIITLGLTVKELTQLSVSPLNYFKTLSNWFDIILIALITIVVYLPNELIRDPLYFSMSSAIDPLCTEDKMSANVSTGCTQCCQEQKEVPKWIDPSDFSVKRGLSAFLIVLSTARVIFIAAKHPGRRTERFNKYVRMYRKVASSFLKILSIYSLFIVAFAMGFYILFHNDLGDAKLNVQSLTPYVFFDTPLESVVKTIAMFIGELDFNNIPIGINYGRRDGNVSVALGYLFYLIFMFSVTIVLMNLLNGLAVTDITAIVRESEVSHQASIIEMLESFEKYGLKIRKMVHRLSRVCPCLKPLLLKLFDRSDKFRMYTSEKSSWIQKRKNKKVRSSEDDALNSKGCIKRFNIKYLGAPSEGCCERIISEAREKLLALNRSQISERSLGKKQSQKNKGEIEMGQEKKNIDFVKD
jgi:hypothetical protein